ncbi:MULTISPECIES: hypothetical protein [Methylomonas]|uniref:Uncharacterized protein n=1 Tax=Methylomonas koyamae TaxID=702114 RepID=A0A177NXM0_9GAMM|nr:hypothetical protein [Methylomonas koyamae]OAI22394.1 hypothetical protein A1355_01910 [Methylomonas koyamae]
MRTNRQEDFLEECRSLSLTARLLLALMIFERFCVQKGIVHTEIEQFVEYLWQWPAINGPDEFNPWENSRPHLVNYGLGDEIHKEVLSNLEAKGVSEQSFRDIVSGVVEILWGNFWGAPDDDGSFRMLRQVVEAAKVDPLPSITPFKFSRFLDNSGWGQRPTVSDYTFWKACRGYA